MWDVDVRTNSNLPLDGPMRFWDVDAYAYRYCVGCEWTVETMTDDQIAAVLNLREIVRNRRESRVERMREELASGVDDPAERAVLDELRKEGL